MGIEFSDNHTIFDKFQEINAKLDVCIEELKVLKKMLQGYRKEEKETSITQTQPKPKKKINVVNTITTIGAALVGGILEHLIKF